MTRKITIAYSKQPRYNHIDNGTNKVVNAANEMLDDEKFLLNIELRDSKLANIMFDKCQESIDYCNNCVHSYYNQYVRPSYDGFTEKQEQMNAIIDTVNSNGPDGFPEFPIDPAYILKIDPHDTQIWKLNALHEWFEDVQKSDTYIQLSESRRHRISNMCEQVNQLVHSMEGNSDSKQNEIDNFLFLNVVRLSSEHEIEKVEKNPLNNLYKLTEDDYKEFEIEVPGRVYLDFATVGKNLWHCLDTNDIELVQSQKVSPQRYARNYFQYMIKPIRVDENYVSNRQKQMQDWINANNLSQYIDHKLPEHAMGLASIGEIVYKGKVLSKQGTTEDFYELFKKLTTYRYQWGVYFSG